MQKKALVISLILLFLLLLVIVFQTFQESQPIPIPPSGSIVSANITQDRVYVTDTIKIKLSKPLETNRFYIELSPDTDYNLSFNPDTMEISIDPNPAWLYDRDYQMKILKETQFTDGGTLDKDYIFSFKTSERQGE